MSEKRLFPQRKMTAYEAISEAQKIAYGPLVFQAVRVMRDMGILDELDRSGQEGRTAAEMADSLGISLYGVETLVESGLSSGVLEQNENDRIVLSKVGHYLLHDEMTRVNMDYNHYICYQGMFHLDEAIAQQKPSGLKVFGEQWNTLYEALPHLPDRVKNSWYAFDHFYSDSAYPEALQIILQRHPKTLVDIGTNIGKFTVLAAGADPDLRITMIDLSDQLQNAIRNVKDAGFEDRVEPLALDLLDSSAPLPQGRDVYWLSQLLSCFGEDEIVSILARARDAMGEDSRLYILETCWDRQDHVAASYSLINTSLYFTCMASGNSKMYSAERLLEYIDRAGLKCSKVHDGLGICHTLFECEKA